MRRLILTAASAALLATTALPACAQSIQFFPNGRFAGANLNGLFNHGRGYGYPPGSGGVPYGYGQPIYGGAPVIVQQQPVIVTRPAPMRQIILVCDRGGVLGEDGLCHVTRRIR